MRGESVNAVQVSIWRHGERQVLRRNFSCRYEPHAIGVDVGSLLEQIGGNALAVDYEDPLPEGT